ncbi:hypothetical protein AUK04_02505 [Candidatus Roizmanbacteria bacterium CG2_30_33_16]|uniref:UPF0102 protein COW96_04800 n=3 Tax=Candidatus Roizmaniibacteriota TaxID=1752723 RepID=A0A2H0C298_9BACT|nr:MAG: hypothetical protein AUK04_02505 [Candidatus Roizmanbacteria bacterium CG2_30_33_16]PIP64036.1 MAG: hypothetical protein COW96_04800 [Candidatus Roizmanbacteria bacterium CG22_combo_CG10-13_8_21_14_all_33_16]PJB88554.1 MAG: hypothetical protein CO083_02285 [Candidatus Roizmanbacteria bacterium CG_4_9_14_0_8_um_filter_34_12]PJC79821.1 MAG: hypothetical protein CO008_03940 [Candidatus Roizmanbacteria bacterium CG_4_8_14_3_um_filter_36_12]
MNSLKQEVGKIGENAACDYLQKQGYLIIERNFRSKGGEIDIIIQKSNKIVFVEVKTRIGDTKGRPYEAVNYYKLSHLKRAIKYYLLQNPYKNSKLSIFVIGIILNEDHSIKELKCYEDVGM